MKLGVEVGLGSGHIVLNGDPAPSPQKGAMPPPIFVPCLLWPNGWIDQDATWFGSKGRPRPHCVRWRTSSPKRGHSHVCYGQTVPYLSYCWALVI